MRDLSWNLRAGEWPQIQRGERRPYTDCYFPVFSQAIWPGLDLHPGTDEKLHALPLIFDGNGKVPEPKALISLISAPLKGIGVYIAGELSSSQRLPTVAVRKQVGLQPAMEWHFYNRVPQIV